MRYYISFSDGTFRGACAVEANSVELAEHKGRVLVPADGTQAAIVKIPSHVHCPLDIVWKNQEEVEMAFGDPPESAYRTQGYDDMQPGVPVMDDLVLVCESPHKNVRYTNLE